MENRCVLMPAHAHLDVAVAVAQDVLLDLHDAAQLLSACCGRCCLSRIKQRTCGDQQALLHSHCS